MHFAAYQFLEVFLVSREAYLIFCVFKHGIRKARTRFTYEYFLAIDC